MSQQKTQNTQMISGQRITPFGAKENPNLLDGINKSGIMRVDTLVALKDIFGESALSSRQHLYALVSGPESDEVFQEFICSYYKRFYSFANYVDSQYYFEDKSVSLIVRIMKPIRDAIEKYEDTIKSKCKFYNGTYLGNDKDYAYFQFEDTSRLPTIEGSCMIC